MKTANSVDQVINPSTIPQGSRIYAAGNSATPNILLNRLAENEAISGVELLGALLMGDLENLFSEKTCERITHRIIFNGPQSRTALNSGRAMYQLMHLSDIPRQLQKYIQPDVVLLTVSGPDNGGNYSLGTAVEGIPAAISSAKSRGGLVIAERNARMPFVLGSTIKEDMIDYLLDTDYDLPVHPAIGADEKAEKIGRIIAEHYIHDGCTLQYGIGEVPEAVTQAVLDKGVRELGIHTELFATAMRKLVQSGAVTNRYNQRPFSISSLFLAENREGYEWLDYNSSIQSRPCNVTNSTMNIAKRPNMVAVNSAIGVDLHGNIWADSLNATKIFSGIGGQSDFLRGANLSPGGVPIIAMKSATASGVPKILEKSPEGITSTAIAADPVVIVTEQGAFDPRGLSICEHAVGIAHLAEPHTREELLRHIYETDKFHKPRQALSDKLPKGFIPCD